LDNFFERLNHKLTVKRATYFLFSARFVYYEVWKQEDLLKSAGYHDIIMPALLDIRKAIDEYSIERSELTKFLWEVEPYLAYLLDETTADTDMILLGFLQKQLDVSEIFTIPLESLPDAPDTKYGIVGLNEQCFANHQGIFFGEKFYYYSPLLRGEKRC
jgi:hypothetical protein